MTIAALAVAFFVTAFLYSSVGFGGGSTYNALLALGVADISTVPVVALTCNILVVAIGSWRFVRDGHVELQRLWPLVIFSVPSALLGGYLRVPAWLFVGLLALALGVSGLLMLWQPLWRHERERQAHQSNRAVDLASGGALGLLAGVTGIGGGIYLAPSLHLRRWASARTIAGTCAAFILVNSIGGLLGQLLKSGAGATFAMIRMDWSLFPAVVLGGLLGSTLGSLKFDSDILRVLTALLVLYAAVRLGVRFPGEWANR
ncbi:MAG TPA: sulfite exporter TauE/SafE family protein [Sphingomicrobium sp.]|nr:sulfite exporter TauE/SafE family protein [Sphingomicrobium sp.]